MFVLHSEMPTASLPRFHEHFPQDRRVRILQCNTSRVKDRPGATIHPVASLLQASAITKSFAGVHALKGVTFELRASEVHAIVGENGAGKSTLIKIMTGAETADSGTLTVGGRVVPHMDPASARALGIAAV